MATKTQNGVATSRSEKFDMAAMLALNACKMLNYINPDEHMWYRATAALMSADGDGLDNHIRRMTEFEQTMTSIHLRLGQPKHGMIAAALYATRCIVIALQGGFERMDRLDEVRREFKLSQNALKDMG